jgi:hypothetical protein
MDPNRAGSGENVRLYATRARGAGLLASGLALFGLGAAVIAFSTAVPALRGDRELLFGTGLLMAAAGLALAWMGARPRRQWLRCDERGISQPWAVGRPRIAWDDLAEVKMSRAGGLTVRGRSGARVRVAPEVEAYESLLDELCDQLDRNHGAPTRRLWKSRSGDDAVCLGAHTLDMASAGGFVRVMLRDVVDVFMAVDERLRQTPVVTMRSGESLLVPNLGDHTLELYRALRLWLKVRAQTSVSQLVSK